MSRHCCDGYIAGLNQEWKSVGGRFESIALMALCLARASYEYPEDAGSRVFTYMPLRVHVLLGVSWLGRCSVL